MKFDTEDHKQKRLDMTINLRDVIRKNELLLTGDLFDALVYVFTESQQWGEVADLMSRAVPENC